MTKKNKSKAFIPVYFSKLLHRVLFALLFVILTLMAVTYIYIQHTNDNLTEIIPTYYNVTDTCTLSLCDCRCYRSGELPELTNNRLCGSDCLTHYNIKGCQKINNICEPVFDFEE